MVLPRVIPKITAVLAIIPNGTLKAAGILDDLRSNPDIQFYDGFVPGMVREEKWEIRRQGMTADLFLRCV